METVLAVLGGGGTLVGIICVATLALKYAAKSDQLNATTLQLATTQTDAASKASTITTLQAQVTRLQEIDDALQAEAAKLVATPSDPHGAFDKLLSQWNNDRSTASVPGGTNPGTVPPQPAAGPTGSAGPGNAGVQRTNG